MITRKPDDSMKESFSCDIAGRRQIIIAMSRISTFWILDTNIFKFMFYILCSMFYFFWCDKCVFLIFVLVRSVRWWTEEERSHKNQHATIWTHREKSFPRTYNSVLVVSYSNLWRGGSCEEVKHNSPDHKYVLMILPNDTPLLLPKWRSDETWKQAQLFTREWTRM